MQVLSQWDRFQLVQLQEPVRIAEMAALTLENRQDGTSMVRMTRDADLLFAERLLVSASGLEAHR